MTQITVRYQTKNTHGNRDDIDRAGLSWNYLDSEISVYEAPSNAEKLNIDILIEGTHYLEVMKKQRDLKAHFKEHGITLEEKGYPIIIQNY